MPSDTLKRFGDNSSPPMVPTVGHGSATTSPSGISFSLGGDAIPPEILAYFRARLRDQFHDLVLQCFVEQKRQDPTLSQVTLANRLGKRPEQINRWLSSSGNWQSDTVSDLLLAISAHVLTMSTERIQMVATPRYSPGLDWTLDIPEAGAVAADSEKAGAVSAQLTPKYITVRVDINRVETDLSSQPWMAQTFTIGGR